MNKQAIIGRKYRITGGDLGGIGTVIIYVGDGHGGSKGGMFEAEDRKPIKGFDRIWKNFENVEPVTPVTEAGLEVGKQYKVTENAMFADAGEVVTLDEDDGTDIPLFRDAQGRRGYMNINKVREITPAELNGLTDGTKAQLLEAAYGNPAGTLVKFQHDDKSDMPLFEVLTGPNKGELMYFKLHTVSTSLTPAQERGYQIGDVFRVTRDSNFNMGDIVTFTRDDDSNIPYFTGADGEHCEHLDHVEPYVLTFTIAPEPVVNAVAETINGQTIIRINTEVSQAKLQAIMAIIAI